MAFTKLDEGKEDILGINKEEMKSKIDVLAEQVTSEESSLNEKVEAENAIDSLPEDEGIDVAVLGPLKGIGKSLKQAEEIYEAGDLPLTRPEAPNEEVLIPENFEPPEGMDVFAEDYMRGMEQPIPIEEGGIKKPTGKTKPQISGTALDYRNIKTHEEWATHFQNLYNVSEQEAKKISQQQTWQEAIDRGWTKDELKKFLDPTFIGEGQTWTQAEATVALMEMKAADVVSKSSKQIMDLGGWDKATPEMKLDFENALAYSDAITKSFRDRKSDTGRALNFAQSVPGRFETSKSYIKQAIKSGGEQMLAAAHGLYQLSTKPSQRAWVSKTMAAGKRGYDMMMYSYYNSMLSNPETFMRIIGGNALFTMMRAAERPIAAAYGQGRYYTQRALGNKNAVRPISSKELMMNMMTVPLAIKDSFRIFGKTFMANKQHYGVNRLEHKMADNPFEFEITDKDNGFSKLIKTISKGYGMALSPVNRGIMGLDDGFKAFNMHIELSGLAARQADVEYHRLRDLGVSEEIATKQAEELFSETVRYPTEAMWEDATRLGEEITLTNQLTGAWGDLQKFVNRFPGAKILLPFQTSPANMITRSTEYIPLAGLASKQFRKDLLGTGPAHDIAVARMSIGAGAGLALWDMMANNYDPNAEMGITGAMMYDPVERKIRLSKNEQPFSVWHRKSKYTEEELAVLAKDPNIKITEERVYMSYLGFEPFSAIVGAWATAGEYISYSDDKDNAETLVASLAEGTAAYIKDMPTLSQLSNFYDSVIFKEKTETATQAIASELSRAYVEFGVRGTPAGAYSGLIRYVDGLYNPDIYQGVSSDPNYGDMSPLMRNVVDVIQTHRVKNPVWRAFHDDGIHPKYEALTGANLAQEGSMLMRAAPTKRRTEIINGASNAIAQSKVSPIYVTKKLDNVPLNGEQKSFWEKAAYTESLYDYEKEEAIDGSITYKQLGFAFGGRTYSEELARISSDKEFIRLIASDDPEEREEARNMVRGVNAAAKKHAKARLLSEPKFSNLAQLIADKVESDNQAYERYLERMGVPAIDTSVQP
jgi:hypothetical protein